MTDNAIKLKFVVYLTLAIMKAPAYVWVCHSCEASNEANTSQCASCGFPAVASAKDIEKATGEPTFRFTNVGVSLLAWIVFFPIAFVLKVGTYKAPWWAWALFGIGGFAIFLIQNSVARNDR